MLDKDANNLHFKAFESDKQHSVRPVLRGTYLTCSEEIAACFYELCYAKQTLIRKLS